MSDSKKKHGFITKDFRDAGTEQHFSAGSIEQFEEGAFGNYEAAGLVRAPTKEDQAANKAADSKATPAS